MHRCRFGVELPYTVADPFRDSPTRFWACRRMKEGVEIPVAPYGPERIGRRLRELGAAFAGYDLAPDRPEVALAVADWASRFDLGLLLNNPVAQINGAPAEDLPTWMYPAELVRATAGRAALVGILFDELAHHQLHPFREGQTNRWHALADVADCTDPAEAYSRVEAGMEKVVAAALRTGAPVFGEQVMPVLHHAFARAGGAPGCKVLKEQQTPLALTLCMSAAWQYGRPWWATVDLWSSICDCGPWYQAMTYFAGHPPVEYENALRLLALLNPVGAMTETADILWEADQPGARLTAFGAAHRRFATETLPRLAPAFDHASWRPSIVIVHAEDGCWTKADPFCSEIPNLANPAGCLLGAPRLPIDEAATRWLELWRHLSWGHNDGGWLWQRIPPREAERAQGRHVGGTEHDPAACPPLEERADPARPQTRGHRLFSPLNNVAVCDGYVEPHHLASAELVVLCGSYATETARAAVEEAARGGADVLCQATCAPAHRRASRGEDVGRGRWWTVESFDEPAAVERLETHRGQPLQWRLVSGLGELRIHPTDPWGNEIAWELHPA